MGLFDFLSSKPTPNKIAKLQKRMLNEHHQVQVRQESMDELVSFGTPEAILALVSRLGMNFRDTIKNEQEKRWVSDTLVEKFGQEAIEPLETFIGAEQTISAAIRVLTRLIDDTRMTDLLVRTLASYDPADHRTTDAKLQLVDALADYKAPEVVPTVRMFASDHDDQVRVKVIDLLEDRVTPKHAEFAATLSTLIDVVGDPEVSARITRRAADAIIKLGGELGSRSEGLAEFLPDDYAIEGTKLIKR